MNEQYIHNRIQQERKYQNYKWGEQNHTPMEWLSILGEEFGEVCRAAADLKWRSEPASRFKYRRELIQVAAVAVAMIENLDRSG